MLILSDSISFAILTLPICILSSMVICKKTLFCTCTFQIVPFALFPIVDDKMRTFVLLGSGCCLTKRGCGCGFSRHMIRFSYITSASLTWALYLIVLFFFKRTCLNWLRSAPCLVGWRMREAGGRSEDVLLHNWIPFSYFRITNQVSHYFYTAITKLGQCNMWTCESVVKRIYQYNQNDQPPNYNEWIGYFQLAPVILIVANWEALWAPLSIWDNPNDRRGI